MNLEELTADEMNAVERIGQVREFAAGSCIIEKGATGSSFFLILTGDADVRMALKNGKYRSLIKIGPCGVFGEMCFLGVEKRSATVMATTDCKLLEFERADFVRLMTDQPSIGMKVYRGMAQDLARRLATSDESLRDALAQTQGELGMWPGASLRIGAPTSPRRPANVVQKRPTKSDPWSDAID